MSLRLDFLAEALFARLKAHDEILTNSLRAFLSFKTPANARRYLSGHTRPVVFMSLIRSKACRTRGLGPHHISGPLRIVSRILSFDFVGFTISNHEIDLLMIPMSATLIPEPVLTLSSLLRFNKAIDQPWSVVLSTTHRSRPFGTDPACELSFFRVGKPDALQHLRLTTHPYRK